MRTFHNIYRLSVRPKLELVLLGLQLTMVDCYGKKICDGIIDFSTKHLRKHAGR